MRVQWQIDDLIQGRLPMQRIGVDNPDAVEIH